MSPSAHTSDPTVAVIQLRSHAPFPAPPSIDAAASLLVHTMRAAGGGTATATSLLFVPRDDPPPGGWPVIAWVHGTSTGGQPLRAPSLSPTLDGDLTADGAVTGYVEVIRSLVAAGFAVVSPDLEGLGPHADVPHPYFDSSSLGRSLVAGVQAAHLADDRLAPTWAAVGHSEGGHGALVAESFAREAPELSFVTAVAFAPFTSVTGIVGFHGDRALREPEQAIDHVVQQHFNVALIAAGLRAQDPGFDLSSVMGRDLERLMSSVISKGSVAIVTDIKQAVTERTIALFDGTKPGWELVPAVRSYLSTNDLAVMDRFMPLHPTLILQGQHDVSVPESLTSAFIANLGAAAVNIEYRLFASSDHFTIVPDAMSTALAFLSEQFAASSPNAS